MPGGVTSDPESFYDAYGETEWDRLVTGIDGRPEFERTKAQLNESLPASEHVLDAGGGSGRYAIWLAEQGYDVTLVDLSRKQLEIAKRKVTEHGVENAVDLSRQTIVHLGFDADCFDAPSVSVAPSPIFSQRTNVSKQCENSVALPEPTPRSLFRSWAVSDSFDWHS